MRVEGRGSGIHLLFGTGSNGNFICLPEYKRGCYMAHFSDTFWNEETLTPLIGEVDATTVASALKFFNQNYLG